jgi:preprotein translocase subunit YajC
MISQAFAAIGTSSTTSPFAGLMPIILIFFIFYFLLIRPQQKRVKEHKLMIEGVKKGDVVVTAGGVIGKILKVEENDIVVLEIADSINVKVLKSTIANLSQEKFKAVEAKKTTAKNKKQKIKK